MAPKGPQTACAWAGGTSLRLSMVSADLRDID
jgi:hypothetical protein